MRRSDPPLGGGRRRARPGLAIRRRGVRGDHRRRGRGRRGDRGRGRAGGGARRPRRGGVDARRALATGSSCGGARGRCASPSARRARLVGRHDRSAPRGARAGAGGGERRGRLRGCGAARARAGRRGGRGDAQAVVRSPHRWRAELLLAAGGRGRQGARASARPSAPDAGPRGRLPRGGGRRVHRGLCGRAHAEPVRRLQRRAAHRRDARPGRPPRCLHARDRPLRPHR